MAGFLPYLLGLICAFCSCSACLTSLGKPESTQPLVRQSRALRRSVSSFRTRLSGTAKEERGDINSVCWVCSRGRAHKSFWNQTKQLFPFIAIVGFVYLLQWNPQTHKGLWDQSKGFGNFAKCFFLSATLDWWHSEVCDTILSKCKNNDLSCGREILKDSLGTGKEFLRILDWTQEVIMGLSQQSMCATAPIYPKTWRFYNWK